MLRELRIVAAQLMVVPPQWRRQHEA